jgi:hypothetical protein
MGRFLKDLSEEATSYPEYLVYLESIKGDLPTTAYEYGKAPWHYDISNPRSIHDAWLKRLVITEEFGEQRPTGCARVDSRLNVTGG